MKRICLTLVLMLIAFVSFAQVKKVIIKTNSVQYGTQVKYKGLDVWKMDGDAVPSGLLFVIKDGKLTSIEEDGGRSVYNFKERTEFHDDYTEITFIVSCNNGYEYHVKIDRVKCCIEFAYHNGINWRLTRYEMEAIKFSNKL